MAEAIPHSSHLSEREFCHVHGALGLARAKHFIRDAIAFGHEAG
jgi:hypothetical protein